MDRSALKLVDFSGRINRETAAQTFPYGLAQRGVHEVVAATYADLPVLSGFALAAGARQAAPGALVWIENGARTGETGQLCARGMVALGLSPRNLVIIEAKRPCDALWALEEAMKSGAVALVVAELADASFTATRRLALASEARGVPAILLMDHRREGATAAATRWRVSARPSSPNRWNPRAPGHIRWRAVLERARTCASRVGHVHDLELDDETLSLRMVSGLVTGPAVAAETPTRAENRRSTG